ncbi:MAG: DUF1232 domain-containing protein [Bacteroidaceae bacterium]|nr:DUF1232 domain-containing protein [Bacteroidaceae bacterium]
MAFIDKLKQAASNVTTNVQHAVQQFDVNDILDKLDTFKQYFSDSKLLEKITNVAKTAGATVIYPVLLLYDLLKSPDTDLKQKGIIIGALGYFILPVDVIPDFIPVQGFADDAAALMAILTIVATSVTIEMKNNAKQQLHQWLGEFDEKLLSTIDSTINKGKKN